MALTVLLYAEALALPLFSDDLVQIPWLESISWREIWTSPSPYGYYRPLWYSLWRVWGHVTGGLQPAGLHFLNLAAHAVAAWLTGLLAAAWLNPQTEPKCIAACLSTAVFAAFPFSRQAIAWPGAVYNPLVSGLAAAALLAYNQGRRGRGWPWFIVALLLAGAAPLCYEAGLMVAPLLVAAEGLHWMRQRWSQRFSWWSAGAAGVFLAALVLWRTMRQAGVTGFGLTPVDLRQNAAFLLQGLIYPVAPLAQRLATWQGVEPELILWIVALPVLASLVWSARRRYLDGLMLAGVWFGLFALPPLVSMEADWFALAPRFLYPTAVSAGLVWTAGVLPLLERIHPTSEIGSGVRLPLTALARSLLAGVVGLTLVGPAACFVRRGVNLYALAGESIWQAARAAEAGEPLLLVNLPMRITPAKRTYPLGFEGITPLPTRVTARGLVQVNAGWDTPAESVAFGIAAVDQPAGYTYRLHGREIGWEELAATLRTPHAVYLTRYEEERIHLAAAGSSAAVAGGPPQALFQERIGLLAATAACDQQGRIHLETHWRVEEDVGTDVTVFAHLLDGDGALVAQADGYPLLGLLPFWLWEPGQALRDFRSFAGPHTGPHTIRLGLWALASGERWPAEDYPDGVVTLSVECP